MALQVSLVSADAEVWSGEASLVVAKTVLGTVAGTFFLVALINGLSGSSIESPQPSASTVQAIPVPVVMTAGRGNDSLAAGPGLFLRF